MARRSGFLLITPLLLGFTLWSAQALAAKPVCGNAQCEGNESKTCPIDCLGEPPPADVCGDGVCGSTESCSSCADDCGECPVAQCNNDGVCNIGEDCRGCGDCPGRTGGKPSNRFCCGDSTCAIAQCGPGACSPVPVCGNGILEYDEACDDGNLAAGDGCDMLCQIEPNAEPIPSNQFNIGDSIGEGEAANGSIGSANHDKVWSTGFGAGDGVYSLNERFAAEDPAYTPNSPGLDPFFNQAVSGSQMIDFADQAQMVADAAAGVPSGEVGMVTVLMGANDVCASSLSAMTDTALFEAQYRAGLDILANSPSVAQDANLLVSSIPAIYWLWESKRGDLYCRVLAWPFVPCENLLSNAADDCASDTSRNNPDVIDAADGPNCVRRKQFHARIRDEYNPILERVTNEYRGDGKLPNADYVDVFDVRFSSVHVNGGDCFHPSTAGHSLLSGEQWCRSRWGENDPACQQ